MTVTILSPTRYCTNQAIEYMIDKYCPKDNVTILDVGCGKGNYSQFFSSQQIEGSYLGIDIEKHESWQSREENNTQIDYLVYNAEELQDFDRKFDFIISVQSLEHIMNDTVAVKGMTTCLNDGGHITLTVPSKYYFLLYPKHGYRGYKLADIKRLATENGLHIEEIIKIGGLTNIILHFVLWTIPEELMGHVSMSLIFFAIIIISPLFVTITMFIASAVLHLLLLIVRGGKNGFEATFRVVSYSQAAQIWGVIPFVGGFIGGLWILIVQIIGLREIHETSYLRVILALLIPVALILLLVLAIVIPLLVFGLG